MLLKRNYASFGFDTLVENLTPKEINRIIPLFGFLTAIVYVPLVDGGLSFWPVLIAALTIPLIAMLLYLLYSLEGANFWFWAAVLNCLLPIIMSGAAFTLRQSGFTGLGDTIHSLRWWSLILPHLATLYICLTIFLWKQMKGVARAWRKLLP